MNVRPRAVAPHAAGVLRSLRALRSSLRHRRADRAALPRGRAERARVPGTAEGAEPRPGGGVVRFARTTLLIRVTAGGAVFCGWDGAEPEPSYALPADAPEADARAELEPDKDGGWRVVSERVTVTVSRHGAMDIRTPGGAVLRHCPPPRWWAPVEAAGGEGEPWVLRSEVPADARFFGLGGRTDGPRLRSGHYRLWNADGLAEGPGPVTMPLQLVVADAGSHLLFHDDTWDGRLTLREGEEGAGSGHDRPGRCELRMTGGPLRFWIVVGTPARLLQGWTALTGAPAVPPLWALGHHLAQPGLNGERSVREAVARHRRHGLPLSAVHVDAAVSDAAASDSAPSDTGRPDDANPDGAYPDSTRPDSTRPHTALLALSLRAEGVRLVSALPPDVRAAPGDPVYESGLQTDAFVRDARGRTVTGVAAAGVVVHPDFTDPRVRKWWGGLCAERAAEGFSGVRHHPEAPAPVPLFGRPGMPLSARHALEGRGGDHREAHNVYGLAMARAGHDGLSGGDERPFVVSRSGWAGLQRYGGIWPDAVPPDWAALRAALSAVLGLGLCGVPYTGAGGFTGTPTVELCVRRLQLVAYLPLSLVDGGCGQHGAEPLQHARAALLARERLLPYLTTLAHVAHRTGAPYARPLWWDAPGDRTLRDCGDAFLLGDALLVAPVLEPGVRRRTVPLPPGRWYDTATGRPYRRRAVLDAPLDRIPVLARAGSVVPLAAADGGLELEVWAPERGRTGGGLLVTEGPERVHTERYTVRRLGGVAVTRQDDSAVELPVRVRGL